LKVVAEKTGGRYFRATDTEALEKIYEEIDKMEKTEARIKEYTEYFELYPNTLNYIRGSCFRRLCWRQRKLRSKTLSCARFHS